MSRLNFLSESAAAKAVARGTTQALPAASLFLTEATILQVCQVLYRQGYRVVAIENTQAWSENPQEPPRAL